MSRTQLFAIVAAVLLTAPLAAKKVEEKAVVADTPQKFEVLVEAIQQEMAPGKRYEFLDTSNRTEVNDILARMHALLVKAGSVDAMSPDQRAQLMTEQDRVNGILARNADDRLVCTHVAPVGSHLPVTRCKTVRQIAQQRAGYRNQAEEMANEQRAINANDNAARFNGNDNPRN